jgi:hypothetical protein
VKIEQLILSKYPYPQKNMEGDNKKSSLGKKETCDAPARSRTEGAGFKVLSDNHYTTRARDEFHQKIYEIEKQTKYFFVLLCDF